VARRVRVAEGWVEATSPRWTSSSIGCMKSGRRTPVPAKSSPMSFLSILTHLRRINNSMVTLSSTMSSPTVMMPCWPCSISSSNNNSMSNLCTASQPRLWPDTILCRPVINHNGLRLFIDNDSPRQILTTESRSRRQNFDAAWCFLHVLLHCTFRGFDRRLL
jgi:hypothetical protein